MALCAKCYKREATHQELMDLADKGMAYVPMRDECESNIVDKDKRDSIPLDKE